MDVAKDKLTSVFASNAPKFIIHDALGHHFCVHIYDLHSAPVFTCSRSARRWNSVFDDEPGKIQAITMGRSCNFVASSAYNVNISRSIRLSLIPVEVLCLCLVLVR